MAFFAEQNHQMAASCRKKVLALIIIGFMVRLFIASSIELGNDEVYYWTYSQYLQWNYFDHPPMIALFIRFFTGNLSLQHYEIFVRLGSIVSCAIATWILYDLGRKLHSEKAGWFIACLYNASIYAGILAGVFALPDSPQMVFWCLSLWLIVKILKEDKSYVSWLLFGISTGLCIMSKVHGIFLWFGLGLFILVRKREWLKLPQLYLAIFTSIIIASPILFWNISNNFITYKFHSSRVAIHSFSIDTDGILREFFGQLLYNNPVIVILTIIALIALYRNKTFRHPALSVYAFIGIPMALLLLAISLFRDTLPHWSGPAYVSLLPIAAIYLSERNKFFFPAVIKAAFGIILFAAIAGILLINYYPGTLNKKSSPNIGEGDFTLDIYGWRQAGEKFQNIYQKEIKDSFMPADAPMVCYKWFPAAHEEYYFCQPVGITMIGLGEPFDLHEYLWYNAYHKTNAPMDKAWCVVPSNEQYNVQETYAAYYTHIDFVGAIPSWRGSKLARVFYIYILSGWKGAVPSF